MFNTRLSAGLFSLMCATASIAVASEYDDADMFGFEEAPGLFSELRENSQYHISLGGQYFFNDQNNRPLSQLTALVKSTTYGSLTDNTTLNIQSYFAYTNEKDTIKGALPDFSNSEQTIRFFDFNELYVNTMSELSDINIGKQITHHSLSEINSITDVYNSTPLFTPLGHETQGRWQLRYTYYTEVEDQLSLTLFPFPRYPSLGNADSRWYDKSLGYPELVGNTITSSYTISKSDFPSASPKFMGALVKVAGSRGNMDFFGGLYQGLSHFATLEEHTTNVLTIHNPQALQLTAGISQVIKNWRVYGEMLVQRTQRREDDSFAQFLLGAYVRNTGQMVNALGLKEITTTIELGHDSPFTKQSLNTRYFASSSKVRNHVNSLASQWVFVIHPAISVFSGVHYNYRDYGRTYFLGSKLHTSESLFIQLTYAAFEGPQESLLGKWSANKNLQMAVSYQF